MKLINLTIKEPSDSEFKAFKREFLEKKAKQYYEADTKREIEALMLIVGKTQSERDELIERLNDIIKIQYKPKFASFLNLTKKKLPWNDMKLFVHGALNELLFMELKYGNFYGN